MLVIAQCLFPENPEKDASISLARLIGIKWSAGDNLENLNIVDEFFEMLDDRYPDLLIADKLPKEYELLFRYVFGRIKIPIDSFPSNQCHCSVPYRLWYLPNLKTPS